MLGLIVRIFLVLGGFVASFFVTRDALNFDIVQMVIGILLFTFAVAMFSFWPYLKKCIIRILKK